MKTSKFFLLTFALFVFVLTSCSKKTEKGDCCKTGHNTETEKALEISDESVFLIESQWENQKNEQKKLSDYGGKVIVGAMIFTNCPSACPRIVADLKIIESTLSEDERARIQFLLISMDPERDNPAQMSRFASDHRLNGWEIIRSDKSATMEIANVLGVRVKPLKEGGFDHSNIIQLLNAQGEIVFQQQGLNVDPVATLKEIRKLLKS
ncbi:MAG: SCO family protein [Bacteroidetes bacterium HGW-Bacteroidetes-11]|jgi:protein SCO1/2|nr:MAG: SCO family protein [Bacteroidetes bacterium HGW-Bacteroidetes-11]